MMRIALLLSAVACLAGAAFAQQEDVSIRGNFPQLLARGETTPQMAQRIAALVAGLDRRIAPPCGMKRIFSFAGADHVDSNDVSRRVDPGRPGVWRIVVTGNGCWTPRTHNVFLFSRGASPAALRLGVPGRSVAGVKHQQDATLIVLREANRLAAYGSCGDRAFLTDTSVSTPRRSGGAWDETWSASGCEVVRKFLVMFKPEGDKMRISVVPAN